VWKSWNCRERKTTGNLPPKCSKQKLPQPLHRLLPSRLTRLSNLSVATRNCPGPHCHNSPQRTSGKHHPRNSSPTPNSHKYPQPSAAADAPQTNDTRRHAHAQQSKTTPDHPPQTPALSPPFHALSSDAQKQTHCSLTPPIEAALTSPDATPTANSTVIRNTIVDIIAVCAAEYQR